MVCQLCLNSVYGLFSMLQVLYRSVFASQKGRNVLLYQYEDLRAKQIESILTSTSSYLGMFGVFMEFVFSVSLSAVTISSWIIASLDSQGVAGSPQSSSLKWSSQLGGLVNSFLILLICGALPVAIRVLDISSLSLLGTLGMLYDEYNNQGQYPIYSLIFKLILLLLSWRKFIKFTLNLNEVDYK
ncbi:hypothetical protein MP228_004117 [Amoeboaphelidium protococcarum]|nr:hypothetical protein MP228_004117 [Amoeboaphelidium protococcarum]